MKRIISTTGLLPILVIGMISLFNLSCQKEATKVALSLPKITTNEINEFTETSITCGGHVTSDGGSPVIARGVYWNTKSNVITEKNKTVDGKDTGYFTSVITGLLPRTTYYIISYATTDKGTTFGNEVSILTEVAPCTPEKNSINMVGFINPVNYFTSTYASFDNQSGNYEIEGNASRATVKISFAKEPSTGKYYTSDEFFAVPVGDCRVESTFSGTYYYAPDNKEVYVIKKGKNKYIVNFCSIPFSSFSSNCNVTVE